MKKQYYNFEVKFIGPLVDNILSLKDKLSKEEMDAVHENFFERVGNDEFSSCGSIIEDSFYADYSIEADSTHVALRALQLELELLTPDGLYAESIKKLDL